MRVACYARYSSDLQRETSIEDQLAVAKRYAEEQGWTVLEDHIYTDAAASGASIQGRAGVQRLLSSAEKHPKSFDVLLVDDSSRHSTTHLACGVEERGREDSLRRRKEEDITYGES